MKKKFVSIGIGAAIVIVPIIIILAMLPNQAVQDQPSPLDLDFSYEEANYNLKQTLHSYQINMTNPLKFSSDSDIRQYCNFFSDQTRQALVKFCTSTELKDENGNFLGNISMVGSTRAPGLVIVALQSDSTLSNLNDVKTVFGVAINETVCTCWSQQKPGGYATISDMINSLRDFQIAGKQTNSTTHTVPLGSEHFEMELTTNQAGYLWKLLVAR